MNGHCFTAAEIAAITARYPDELTATIAEALGLTRNQIHRKARALGLSKSAAFYSSTEARLLDGRIGAGTRFAKGHVPANKGVKGWQAGGGALATQFKPGHHGGRAAQNYKPIGAERISKEGYRERKINDGLPLKKRWRAVHLIMWEEVNGPLPAGHVIAFRNGNKLDLRQDNFELITRQELMRRNSYHTNCPKELARVIQLRGALNRKINNRTRKESHGQ